MTLTLLALAVMGAFGAAYVGYGRVLKRFFRLDDARVTPARELNDGIDFCPTPPGMLAAQHFSAITAAGPVIGPISAGLMFGWLPALLWIVFGCIFVGAVHDFSALVASVRHKARSVAEVMKEHTSGRSYYAFLIFIWLSLMYVMVAFTDLTSKQFVAGDIGPGVASSSLLYLVLAFILGVAFKKGLKTLPAGLIFVPLLFALVWFGQKMPIGAPAFQVFGEGVLHQKAHFWAVVILVYCGIASIVPLWALLQPRGFLGGWFLYVTIAAGLLGVLVGPLIFKDGFSVTYPAFFGWRVGANTLFPFLFVTIACGACSGFHGIVCSGTTSKQIEKEGHAHAVGYGSMLGEGVVAFLSLATVMILAKGTKGNPNDIYANGIANFLRIFYGSNQAAHSLAIAFGNLAVATFIFDTLDVCTRLGRQIFCELFRAPGPMGRIVGTIVTLAIPGYFLLSSTGDAWKTYWLVFGTSNQLLAGLTLLGITVWLVAERRPSWFVSLPMAFLIATTMTSLLLFIRQGFAPGASFQTKQSSVVAAILFGLAGYLVVEAVLALRRARLTPAVA